MNVLVVGSGGREHVLAWKINQSPLVNKIYCAPGNGGIAQLAECVQIDANNIDELIQFAKVKNIGLTVIGPEAPLVDGIVDAFEANGLKVFGPSQAAARLEGSKVFSKEFMHRHKIPTAFFKTFKDIEKARAFIDRAEYPLVVKASGLAAGKGVIICENLEQAHAAVNQIMGDKVFKDAGNEIVIEEYLAGEEMSILAISDGNDYVLLETSQDHKRIFDDDLGPNTGGMGAYSPAPLGTKELLSEIRETVIGPTIEGMKGEGAPFKGVLYAGLMITDKGVFVLEYNVRLGDPEAQAVLPRLESDLLQLMIDASNGGLGGVTLKWSDKTAVCVVIASGGYPGKYENGFEIKGLQEAAKDALVFHAGTKIKENKIVTAGGRVLGVTSLGDGILDTIKKVYVSVEKISFDHCFFRRDIGAKALKKTNV